MHTEGFSVDDLVYWGSAMVGSRVQVHLPLPGSGNQTRHNRPSIPLGFRIFADIHLMVRRDKEIFCVGDPNEP